MSLLGIDVGTSGCKAATFSADGQRLVCSQREYPAIHPRPDWSELDSRCVWAKVKDVIAEVARGSWRDPVTALCVSSMGEAVTPVSAQREILGNCILSSDIRGEEYVDRLRSSLGAEAFYRINPNILGPNYSLPKILWLKDHEPRVYDQADTFLLWGDLVPFLLGGEATASFSLANRTLLFDIRREDWSGALLERTGVPRGKLGRTAPGGSVIGEVSDGVAREMGLPRGVKIVAGGHDQCCNALGAGIFRAGRAVCGIGTFECITPVYDRIPEPATMLRNGFNVEHHVLPGLYVSFIYNQAGSLVRWFRDTFAAADAKRDAAGRDLFDVLGDEMPAEPGTVLVLPYFEMTGPPGFVSDASGVIAGLKMTTERGAILKGIMECVTFYFIESIRALQGMGINTSEFVATGGGARSDRWLQIKADILGVPFMRPQITETSVLGAAILAGVSTGVLGAPEEGVARFVKRDRVFEPDEKRRRVYERKYAHYRKLFPLLREFLSEVSPVS